MKYSIDKITSILINANYSDIIMEPYDGTELEVITPKDKAYTCKVAKEAFIINQNNISKAVSFILSKPLELKVRFPSNFMGDLKIKAKNGDFNTGRAVFSSVDIQSINGDYTMSQIKAKRVSITIDNGAVNLKEVLSPSVVVKVKNGGIKLDDVTSEELSAIGANTMISLAQIKSSKITAKTNNGRIDIKKTATDNLDLFERNGKIIAQLFGNAEDYKFTTDTKNGFISVNSDSYGKLYNTPIASDRHINIHSINGNIDVKFIAAPDKSAK